MLFISSSQILKVCLFLFLVSLVVSKHKQVDANMPRAVFLMFDRDRSMIRLLMQCDFHMDK